MSSDADLAESIKQWLSDDGRLAFGVAVTETRWRGDPYGG